MSERDSRRSEALAPQRGRGPPGGMEVRTGPGEAGKHRTTGRRGVLLIVLGLTLLAAVPRLVNLGRLSFYSDEETTAFPARALAEGHGPRMPSGMEYRRALPLTWLNAASASLLGKDRELSYRLPTALFGILTVPLLFLVGRSLVGGPAGLVAASMLALSEWHLAWSRQARMYVAFLFFFVLAVYAAWRWAEGGNLRTLILAVAAFAAAVSLHALAVLGAALALIPLAIPKGSRVSPWKLLAFAALAAVAALMYARLFVQASYWQFTEPYGTVRIPGGARSIQIRAFALETVWAWMLVLGGAALGVVAALRAPSPDRGPGSALRRIALFIAAALTGLFSLVGELHAAALAVFLFLFLHQSERGELARRLWPTAALFGLAALGWIAVSVFQQGVSEGVKAVSAFPFPYLVYLARQSLGVTLVFAGFCLWLVLHPSRPGERGGRACVLGAILILVAIGSARSWGPTRFLLPAYPFLLLAAAYGLVEALRLAWLRTRGAGRTARWGTGVATVASLLVVGTGVLGGHGLPQAYRVATLRHGEPINELTHLYPFRPDHERPGQFVLRHRAAGDVVIAEDPLQQRWYAGPIDYWLRRFNDARKFLYVAPNGELRDIYVNSRIVEDVSLLDSLAHATEGRVWLVTSGETRPYWEHYLSIEQRVWLDSLERARNPEFTGRDSVTRVYCLNCPIPKRVSSPGRSNR